MKITLNELKELYHNRSVILGKTFVVYSNGKTAKDTFRLMEGTIYVNTDNNTVQVDCIRKTKTRIHHDPCCECGYKSIGYSYGIRMESMKVSDIETVYLTSKNEDVKTVTLIGKHTSAQFDIFG